jgi:hypothetical protein
MPTNQSLHTSLASRLVQDPSPDLSLGVNMSMNVDVNMDADVNALCLVASLARLTPKCD